MSKYQVVRTMKFLDAAVSDDMIELVATRVEGKEPKSKNAYNNDLTTTLYNVAQMYEGSKKTLLVGLPSIETRPLTAYDNKVYQDWSTDGSSADDENIRGMESYMELLRKTILKEHKVPEKKWSEWPINWRSNCSNGTLGVYMLKPYYKKDAFVQFDLDTWCKQEEGFPLFKIAHVVVVEPTVTSVGREKYIKVTFELMRDFHNTKKKPVVARTKRPANAEEEEVLKRARTERIEARKSEKDRKFDSLKEEMDLGLLDGITPEDCK